MALLVRRGRDFALQALAVFVAGIAANAAYGLVRARGRTRRLQPRLALPQSAPTRGASQINVYGSVGGEQSVYRPNALTGDPNHLAIMLLVPILALTPPLLRRPRPLLAALLAFLLLVEVATLLLHGGLLGLVVGVAVFAAPYGRELFSRATAIPLALLALLLSYVVGGLDFFAEVISSRLQTGDRATSAHFGVYDFIPDVLATHPLFGLGLNNLSVYSSSGGQLGHAQRCATIAFRRDRPCRHDPVRRVPLVGVLAPARRPHDRPATRVGLDRRAVGTLAANVFYLTMQFYYFYRPDRVRARAAGSRPA